MGELFEKLVLWDHLCDAWLKAARGKGGNAPAAMFEFLLEDELLRRHPIKRQSC